MTVLGNTTPDFVSKILGTGYLRFQSPTGINGLAKEEGSHLHILAVDATQEGKGQFRAFIKRCKHEYKSVSVWEVWNPVIEKALERYGFHRVKEFQIDAEVEGWRWKTKSRRR